MLDRSHKDLSVRAQCLLLKIPRATAYYQKEPQADDSILVNEIYEIWQKKSYYGYRKITAELKRRSYAVNRKRVYRLMREARIQALYPRPQTSAPNTQHKRYPYLLRDCVIDRPNQVWTTDITYIKVGDSWMYLVAILDVHSRYILAWSLSNTLDTEFCIAVLQRALTHATPEILNTDQGSQFTSEEWLTCVESHGIKVSMDGVGRWADNIYIERFWRTVKYEHLFWQVFDSVIDLKKSLTHFLHEYNTDRLHQSLGYHTPYEAYTQKVAVPAMRYKKEKAAPQQASITGGCPPIPPTGGYLASARGCEQSPREAGLSSTIGELNT